jgi:hypothetical protein
LVRRRGLLLVPLAVAAIAPPAHAARPLSPPIRHVADALVTHANARSQHHEGYTVDGRYLTYVDRAGRLAAWDTATGRRAGGPTPTGRSICVPSTAAHGEVTVNCEDEGPPLLFAARTGVLHPVGTPPPPEGTVWRAELLGRSWIELWAASDQFFLSRLTGELRRGGDLVDLREKNLDDPALGDLKPARDRLLVYRRDGVFWRIAPRRLVRVAPPIARMRGVHTQAGRFMTWFSDDFAAAFDTRTRRRYYWPMRRTPPGLGFAANRHAAIFVFGRRPQLLPASTTPTPLEPGRIHAARWP